jgi:hypothetical protein
MWTVSMLIGAALRLIATGVGIVREPTYVVVRPRVRPDEPARDRVEHPA